MSVHKDKKNNTWYVKYKNNTKRGFKTKTEAQRYEAELKLDFNKSCDNIYIFDVAEDYLEMFKTKVTYGTYHKKETIIRNIILPNIKNKKIDKITELDCRKFNEYIGSLDYSTTYKNVMQNTYKQIFKHAIKYYKLSKAPTYVLEPFKESYAEKKKNREKEMNIWSVDEFERFINEVDSYAYKELFIILYFTGIRLGEALGLKWSDFHDMKLSINKSITRKTDKGTFEEKEPKNFSSYRDITLGEKLNDFLESYKENEMRIPGFSEDWYIFGRLKPLPQTSIDRKKEQAIEKAGVKRIRIHDFRHSHASNLIGNGLNIVAVSKRLGHSNVNMTLEKYTHLIQKTDEELVNYVENSSQNLLNAYKKA